MRIVAMRMPQDLDVRAGNEHLDRPARTLDQRCRPHLAAHGERLAVGIDGVEQHVGMWIDELHPGQRPGVFDHLVHFELAETVMRPCGRGERESGKYRDRVSMHDYLIPTR